MKPILTFKAKIAGLMAVALTFFASLPDMALAGLLGLAAYNTSTAKLGTGTILKISAGSPTSYLTVGNVHDYKAMQGSNSEVEVTNMASTAKEFLLDLADNGDATFTVDTDFGDVGQAAMIAAKEANPPTKCDFQIVTTLATLNTLTFQGYVKTFDIGSGVGAAVRSQVVIRVTGPVVRS